MVEEVLEKMVMERRRRGWKKTDGRKL